ncbi:site-specific integrase [Sphingomonas sp. LY29]|uniref:tyrosine-type recombinase/integrase n=1 Tax=Sphingomonas sp. LY29 TaxID=3095341 RepID=UPI002D794462|nr:site-specific integrase [Sphingomonas sp. LY29]WRP26609.1 site-specific integrase [Sphingomonas sp. LY29]
MTAIRKRVWTDGKGEERQAWLVDYRDSGGKRRAKQFARKKDAEAWSTQAAWQVSQGVHTADSQSVTVKQAGDIWIARVEADDRERATVDNYRAILDRHIAPLIGAERLSRLTMPAVRIFADKLLESRSRPTAARALHHLRMILKEAQGRGLVAQNVALGVRLPKAAREKSKVEIPSKVELKAMLDASGPELRPFVMTAIFTGLRASELRGLVWRNLDLKKGIVTVTQRADRFDQIGLPKSEAAHRSVPLPPALVSELKAWKLRCPISKLDLVFPAAGGGVLNYKNFMTRQFLPMLVKAELKRYGLHALRHAAASAWIHQGIDLKRLQTWMGHGSIQLTIDRYGHLLKDDDRDAALAAAAQRELLG